MCDPMVTPGVGPQEGKGLNVMPQFGRGQVVEQFLGLVWPSDEDNVNKKIRDSYS